MRTGDWVVFRAEAAGVGLLLAALAAAAMLAVALAR